MGSVGMQFFDYYKFLGVASDASLDAIRAAIVVWREQNKRDRVHPELHLDVDRRDARLTQAEQILLATDQRRAYDEEYTRRIALQGDGLLWLEPEFVFDASDNAPALTVPALAVKLDDDWPRAIEAVRSRSVEQMLHFVRPRQPAPKQPRYTALENEIGRLRATLAEKRPYQMLESIIVLCDARLPRPEGRVDGRPIEGATLTEQRVRPDQPQTARFRVRRATEVRGCLFGYAWVEDSWASITNPASESFTVDGKTKRGSYFELVGDGEVEFTLSMPSPDLMALNRPESHRLRIVFELQPATSHYHVTRCHMPVAITPIPAKAAFEPAQLTLPIARRGARLSATARLINNGEAPLNAHRALPADPDVTVDDTLDGTGGEVHVTLDTSRLPYGKSFQRTVRYTADGDTSPVTLQLDGELLPTPWQHLFRLQPARDRFTLAGVFALFALAFGPILTGLLSPSSTALAFVCGLAITMGALGTARVIPPRIVRHIRASGETGVTEASIPWNPILIGTGAAAGAIAIVIALLTWDPWLKAYTYSVLGALIAAAWGFFFNEDLAIYPRQAGVTTPGDEKPKPLATGWKAGAIVAAIVLAITSLALDPSLFGALLLFSLPIALLIGVLATRS